jgi:invasion protein IalB
MLNERIVVLSIIGLIVGCFASSGQARAGDLYSQLPGVTALSQSTPRNVRPQFVTEPLRSLPAGSEDAELGDFVSSQRRFGAWVLSCEGLLSARDRVCFIVQQAPVGGLTWRVGLTASLLPVVVLDGPAAWSATAVTIESEGQVVDLPAARCQHGSCEIVVAFMGILQDVLASGAELTVLFGPAQSRTVVTFQGHGFPEAVASLAGPPDGSLYGAVACGSGDFSGQKNRQ